MASKRYSEFASSMGFPKTSTTKQGDEGTPASTTGAIYGARGRKDYPMSMKTKKYSDPSGFKTQPRDRSWGMRTADGLAQCKGLGGPYEDDDNDTYIK